MMVFNNLAVVKEASERWVCFFYVVLWHHKTVVHDFKGRSNNET